MATHWRSALDLDAHARRARSHSSRVEALENGHMRVSGVASRGADYQLHVIHSRAPIATTTTTTTMSTVTVTATTTIARRLDASSQRLDARMRRGRGAARRRPMTRASTSSDESGEDEGEDARATSAYEETRENMRKKPLPGSGVNLYDPVATASRALTRRFGIVGGLGLVAVLASVEGGEIIKALLERDVEVSGEEYAVEGNEHGLRAQDSRIGGGSSPKRGDFVGVNVTITDAVDGTEYLNTKKNRRPIAFTFEKKPLLPPICEAIEDGVRTMKRGGVRRLVAPSAAAFGERGVVLADGTRIPGSRDLIIELTLEEVSPSYV
jgi:hypothetical protein